VTDADAGTPDSGTPYAVETVGLTKRFGTRAALDGVSLRVRTGSVHGLLGPNGAGKTTLLRALFGLVRPDAGTLRLFGREASAPARDRLAGVGGFVDGPRFYPYMSGYRSLEMLASYDGTVSPERIDAALESVGLADRAHERTARYSLGMRQRLGIAAALLRSPRLLVLDEPANGLDPAGARDMRALIRDLAAAGLTVLMSTHVMSDVEALCDAVTILSAGTVASDGSVDDLRGRAPTPMFAMDTSDDAGAAAAGLAPEGVTVVAHPDGGLAVGAHRDDLDAYVLALGRAGIAVRALRLETTPLEALFFTLTEPGPATPTDERAPVPVAG